MRRAELLMLLLCIFTGLEPSFNLAALVTPANLVNHACKLLTCSMVQISGMPYRRLF